MGVGEVLKRLRKEKKLTQGELAKEIGVAKGTIAQYETDKRQPNFESMAKLETFFKVNGSYLRGESDEVNYIAKETEGFELNDFEKQLICFYRQLKEAVEPPERMKEI